MIKVLLEEAALFGQLLAVAARGSTQLGPVTLRVAGGWLLPPSARPCLTPVCRVRDKLLGVESDDVDIAVRCPVHPVSHALHSTVLPAAFV